MSDKKTKAIGRRKLSAEEIERRRHEDRERFMRGGFGCDLTVEWYTGIPASTLRMQRFQGVTGSLPAIPYHRIGRRCCYLREEVDQALSGHRVVPTALEEVAHV